MIKNAVQSILNQSFRDFIHIIVDDGSEQSPINLIKSFNDGRLKYIKRDENEGPAAARNTEIKNAFGIFICFLDDNDEFLPNMIQHLFDVLKTDAKIEFMWN